MDSHSDFVAGEGVGAMDAGDETMHRIIGPGGPIPSKSDPPMAEAGSDILRTDVRESSQAPGQ